MLLTIAGAAVLALGLTLATIGLYGMLRKPDIFHQLHAAGLITTSSIVLILLASVATRKAEIITSAALVLAFMLVTSPLAAHAIGQAAYRQDQRRRGSARESRS